MCLISDRKFGRESLDLKASNRRGEKLRNLYC